MRIVRLAVTVLMLLAVTGPGLFASGFENTGLGITARGMGGAFRAIADDWSAAYYNPAGYAFIIDNQLGASLGLIHFRNEITPDFTETDNFGNKYGWGIANEQTVYNFHRVLNKPSAGFVVRLPFWGETVFGLSAYQPFDNSIRWRLYAPDASTMLAYNPDAIGHRDIPGHHYLSDVDVVAFQLTAAREFMEEKLAIGIGLQLLRGDLWHTHLTFRENPRGDDNPYVNDRPRDRVPQFSDSHGRGWSYGIRGGMLWKLNEKFNVAVSAYLPINVTISGQTRHTYIMPKSLDLERDVAPNSADQLFVSGDILHLNSDFETELQLPASISLGLAYQATEKLTVALDAEYTRWAKYTGLEFTFSNFNLTDIPGPTPTAHFEEEFFTSNLTNPVVWENAGKVALGFRYEIHPVLTLLAGGCADQSPSRSSAELTPQYFDIGTKRSYNGGGILHINQWDVGLITSYYNYPDVNLVRLTDLDNDNMFDNFPGAYKAATYETVLSVGYRF